MADIRIKITTDTSELKKDVAQSSKLLKRMEKSHESSVKKRTAKEAESYEKIDKIRDKAFKDSQRQNKLLEKDNQRRLDREVKAEKDAIREKESARQRFRSFALQAAGQGFGAVGLGRLGAGVGLIGAGGLLGAGAGVAIAALGTLVNSIRNLVGFKDQMIRFGIATRMTNKELMGLEAQIGQVSLTTGVGRVPLLESLQEVFKLTRTVPALDQIDHIARALKVSGQAPAEFAQSIEKIGASLKTTDFSKIFRVYQLFTTTGDVGQTIDALGSALPNLQKTEKNLISLSNIMQLKTFKDIDSLKNLNKEFKNIGVTLFSNRQGTQLRNFNDILADITKKKDEYNRLGREEPEFLRTLDINRLRQIETFDDALADINDKIKEIDKSPLTAAERLQSLFEIIVSETAMPALEGASKALNEFLSDEQRVRDFTEAVSGLASAFGTVGKAISVSHNLLSGFFEALAIIPLIRKANETGEFVDPDIVTSPVLRNILKFREKRRQEKLLGVKALEQEISRPYTAPVTAEMGALPTEMGINQIFYISKDSVRQETENKRGQKVDTTITVLPWEQ